MLNLDEAMADEQTRQPQMVVEMVHEAWGAYRQLGIAPKLSLTPGAIRAATPRNWASTPPKSWPPAASTRQPSSGSGLRERFEDVVVMELRSGCV